MLEILQYIFGSFWRFCGLVVVLYILCPWLHIPTIKVTKRKAAPPPAEGAAEADDAVDDESLGRMIQQYERLSYKIRAALEAKGIKYGE